jgi:hypothetical protein
MKIPASAIRPFEPHGIPKTYMGEMAVQFLVTAIAKGILATELNGLTMSQVNSVRLRQVKLRIEDQLTYGGLERVSVDLLLNQYNELHCSINYVLGGGKQSGTQSGYALYEE